MLLCNYELPPALVPGLALPTPASTATVSLASPTSASTATSSIVVVILVVVVSWSTSCPRLLLSLLLRRGGGLGGLPLLPWLLWPNGLKRLIFPASTTVSASVLLCLLHLLGDEDRVALAVPPSAHIDVDVVNLVVALDDGCSSRTLPFEAHHL
jgi:hypothetical protein